MSTYSHAHSHGHSHGLVHDSIKRSRAGIRAVALALLVLGVTALAQTLVFVASGSVALLADLIHNFATPRPRSRSASPSRCAVRAPSAAPASSSSRRS